MIDDAFEWDDAKAATNAAKHGVTFEMVRDAFADTWADDRRDYGEPRIVMVGRVEERLLSVTHTIRDHRIRIISARAAGTAERRKYHDARL
jgi:uncharacterized DUF497 family protein